MSSSARRVSAHALALCLLLVIAPAAGSREGEQASGSESGRKLFNGVDPLRGRLYTQSDDLPSAVVRCANCHAHGDSAPVAYSNAPRLTPQWLQQDRSRRGGPKSHYDLTRFCSLLRTGVGPDRIVINVEMPRYDLTDVECNSLWMFLTEGPGAG